MGRKVSFCQLRFRRRDKKITVGGRELLPELNLINYFINFFWGCPLEPTRAILYSPETN